MKKQDNLNPLPFPSDDEIDEDLEEVIIEDETLDDVYLSEQGPSDKVKVNVKNHYNASIDDIPLLSAQEEIHYARMVQAGLAIAEGDQSPDAIQTKNMGKLAKQVLTEHNLRLVRSIAREFMNRGVETDDLIQEGNIGLMKVVEKFNPELGYRFSTYATYTIRQMMKRFLQDNAHDVRVPNNVQDKIARIKSTQNFLFQHLERKATNLEVALCIALGRGCMVEAIKAQTPLTQLSNGVDFGDFSPASIEDLLGVTKQTISFDQPISKDDDREWIETICVADSDNFSDFDLEILRGILDKLMTILNERLAFVIANRFGLGGLVVLTYEEIGKHLGLTRERARQLEKEALELLGTSPESTQLIAFLR